MGRKSLPVYPQAPEAGEVPLPQRIATGLHKVGLAMKQQSWLQANEEGLSATQGQILATLVAGAPLTGTELSERLGVTLPTISDSVRVLVEKGMVAKTPDPRHPRASLIAPTARGQAVGARARSWPEYLAEAVETLTDTEQAVFYTGVTKMIQSLQERGLVPVNRMCVTCTSFRPHVHEGEKPHHCALTDNPMADVQLRLDCADHVTAPETERRELWERFRRAP